MLKDAALLPCDTKLFMWNEVIDSELNPFGKTPVVLSKVEKHEVFCRTLCRRLKVTASARHESQSEDDIAYGE